MGNRNWSEMLAPEYYAKIACEIELERLHYPIGKQDQYAASYGGLNYIKFNADDSVEVKPIHLIDMRKQRLEESLMLFYTGMIRDGNTILAGQKQNIPNKLQILDEIRGLADMCYFYFRHSDPTHLGDMLRRGWELKKQLAGGITNPEIDAVYQRALDAGAEGGKICGAGGGGFLLLYVPKAKQNKVRKAVGLKEMEFKFTDKGSEIIYADH